MKHYQNITDEQIANELASLKNYLLICGDTGSGKTKLINRILKHIETLDDTLYIFITNDFFRAERTD
jgi:chromosomal replication initiation ATPase DnaA